MSNQTRRARRGFTLLEVMVVIAIVGVLAALAGVGMMYGTRRIRANNATFEVASLIPVAQARVAATGLPQYVAFWERGGAQGAVLFELPDAKMPPDWTAVDFTTLDTVLKARRIESVALGGTGRPGFVALAGAGLGTKLPEPFQAIDLTVPSATSTVQLLRSCTFCKATTTGTGAAGVVRFHADGTARLLTSTSLAGGAIALGVPQPSGAVATKVVAIATPIGTVRVYR